jgi:hypothetical protein
MVAPEVPASGLPSVFPSGVPLLLQANKELMRKRTTISWVLRMFIVFRVILKRCKSNTIF